MTTILFLAHRMGMGFGVSVVIVELARALAARGHKAVVGCIDHDGSWPELDIRLIGPDPTAIAALAAEVGADMVVAQTTPFFECLPALPPPLRRIAWEHGDPTPALFPDDARERANIALNKQRWVYGAIEGVIASSHFLRHDIGWPQATVIPLGCDHVPDLGKKPAEFFAPGRPLKIGTLMRLGPGEARYKGTSLFFDLARLAKERGLEMRFAAMGRGTEEDAALFTAQGLDVHLNGSDDERRDFLRGLDVFISPSLWEGFNLPLVEAQALGTPALAFDAGAHPEVTPLLADGLDDMLALLAAYDQDRALLADHAAQAYDFVRNRFPWDDAAARLLDLPWRRGAAAAAPSANGVRQRLITSLKSDGLWGTALRIGRALWRRL